MDIIVQATEPSSRPGRISIEETLRRLNERSRANPGQGVILPPRITRVNTGTEVQTTVAVLVRAPLPAGMSEQQRITEVVNAVVDTLDDIATEGTLTDSQTVWRAATGAKHNPVVNGPIEFWTSGDAANTRTREGTSWLALDARENPIGPNDPRLEETTPGSLLDRATKAPLEEAKDLLYALGIVAVPVALAWGASSVSSIYVASRKKNR